MAAGQQDGITGRQHLPELHARPRSEPGRIDEHAPCWTRWTGWQGLLDAVVAISREVELPAVPHRIVPRPWK
ncbi:hypothetical protein [Streptomyces massasporeus]|uniref:hypothetical protein n=1 Tax=Streptomyces massasporeus TaxID=67324 RepID=UPI0037003017